MPDQPAVLIVDDEKNLREVLRLVFERDGWDTSTAAGGHAALDLLRSRPFQVLITDLSMPGMDGIALMRAARAERPDLAVIMLTAFASTESAIDALRAGAHDYLIKPFSNDELLLVARRAVDDQRLAREHKAMHKELGGRFEIGDLVGTTPRMQEILSLIRRVAPTPSTILITGESGTGKEMVARALHFASPRSGEPFLAINCSALTESLLESELFGHVRGAFTGATQDRAGLLEAAGQGTLFLDEIGEMAASMQAKLLRALEERTVRPVGGIRDVAFHARLVVATNRDLEAMAARGAFRQDLFYRLNVIQIHMPPLRERASDIAPLAHALLSRINTRLGREVSGLAPEVLDEFRRYPWPGNVRELQNVLERAVAMTTGDTVLLSALPPGFRLPLAEGEARPPELPADLDGYLDRQRAAYMVQALEAAGGDMNVAAQRLGMSLRSFRYYARKHGVTSRET